MTLRQFDDALPQYPVSIRLGLITQSSRIHPSDAQRRALAQPVPGKEPHQFASSRCGHHFFCSTSLVISFSSMALASMRLSRAFSVSISLRRLASEMLTPPNLLRHK